jgi:nitrite reductase/ring-hydroxylating ferredoxin subunit
MGNITVELSMQSEINWYEGPNLTDIPMMGCLALKVGAHKVVVFRDESKVYAVENRCPHMGYPMSKGTLSRGIITCEWHNWRFDAHNGGCYVGASDDLTVFPTRLDKDKLFIGVSPEREGDSSGNAELTLMHAALLSNDSYLLAKSLSLALHRGLTVPHILGHAIRHATRHGASQHPGVQAAAELTAILACHELSLTVSDDDPILFLTHGIQMTAGPIGERPAVLPLPGPLPSFDEAQNKLDLFVEEQYSSAIERLLLTICASSQFTIASLSKLLIPAAFDPVFMPHKRIFPGLIFAFKAINTIDESLKEDLLPVLAGALLGLRRPSPRPEARAAIELFQEHLPRLEGIDHFSRSSDPALRQALVGELRAVLFDGRLHRIFQSITAALQSGIAVDDILTAMSLFVAERMTRFKASDVGDWPAVSSALRYGSALRQARDLVEQRVRARGLYHLAFDIWTARWVGGMTADYRALQKDQPCGESAETSLDKLSQALTSADLPAVRQHLLGYSLGSADSFDEQALISTLVKGALKDDVGIDLIATVHSGIAEYQNTTEFDQSARLLYLTGIASYIAQSKFRRQTDLSAKFGRNFSKFTV